MNLLIPPTFEKVMLISTGAMLGANARYWLGDWAAQKWGTAFPYGTFLINVTGSLLLGLFMTLATDRLMLDARWRLLLAVGFLGAYTTFSTYTFECFNLLARGEWGVAFFNAAGSAIVGIVAVGVGVFLAKSL